MDELKTIVFHKSHDALLNELDWLINQSEELDKAWNVKVREFVLPEIKCITQYKGYLVKTKEMIASWKEMQSNYYDIYNLRTIFSYLLQAYHEGISNIGLTTTNDPYTLATNIPHTFTIAISAASRIMEDYCGNLMGKNDKLWNGYIVTTHGRDVELYPICQVMGVPRYYLLSIPSIAIPVLSHEASHLIQRANGFYSFPLLLLTRGILKSFKQHDYRKDMPVIFIRHCEEIVADIGGIIAGGPASLFSHTLFLLKSTNSYMKDDDLLKIGYLPVYPRILIAYYTSKILVKNKKWKEHWLSDVEKLVIAGNKSFLDLIKHCEDENGNFKGLQDWNFFESCVKYISEFYYECNATYSPHKDPCLSPEKVDEISNEIYSNLKSGNMVQIDTHLPRYIVTSLFEIMIHEKNKRLQSEYSDSQKWHHLIPLWLHYLAAWNGLEKRQQ